MTDSTSTVTQQVKRVSHITLIVADQDRAVEFYNQAFGTEVRGDQDFEFEGGSMRWVTVGIPGDDLEIAIQTPMAMEGRPLPTAGDNNMTVVEVEDVDGILEAVRDAGGTVASEPEDLPWGRSAVVRDPDGNPWNLVSPNAASPGFGA